MLDTTGPEPTSGNYYAGTGSGPVIQAGAIHGGIHLIQPTRKVLVPQELLPVPAHFANRSAELEKLDQTVARNEAQGRPTLVVITGSGGVGKTALALRWLHKSAHKFPDGKLYADLGAFGPGTPASPTDIVSRFLRALGAPPEHIPLELAAQTALYRSIAAGKSLAVLADDAASVTQVRPLFPVSPGSVMVVTSRWRLGGLAVDGGHFLAVDTLDIAAATDLLTQAVGHDRVDTEPESTLRLVELCGGLPLALRIAAARLSTRPRWPISRIVDALADQRRRLVLLAVNGDLSVQASFDQSYHELPVEAARLYRYLGLHPGAEFGPDVAAVATGIARDSARDLLEILVDASLLTDIGLDRYRFHDLLRLHARQHAEQQGSAIECDTVVQRMVSWYLNAAIAADLVVMPLRHRLGDGYERVRKQPAAFPDALTALSWLEAELPNLLAVMRSASARGWHDVVWQFGEALWQCRVA